MSSSKTIFYKKLKNIKPTLINNGFPNYFVDELINRTIKNVSQQKRCNIKPFYHNQMHYNYKLGENIFKMMTERNILSTDPKKKKIKLIIYSNKVKTSNFVINYNSSSSSIWV